MSPVYCRQPFNISACEVLIELTSFVGEIIPETDGGDAQSPGMHELRPDLMCHIEDVRNLVCVRDWKNGLDAMRQFDVINETPTIEVMFDQKTDKKTGEVKVVYCPKIKLTFYLNKNCFQEMLNIVMPVIFCFAGNLANGIFVLFPNCENVLLPSCHKQINTEGWPDYIANSLAIGLTLVFLMPQISSIEGLKNDFDMNQLLVTFLFLGVVCGFIVPQSIGWYMFMMSNAFFLVGVILTPMNAYEWWKIYRKIRGSAVRAEKPITCCGRPGSKANSKGSDVDVTALSRFWDITPDGKVQLHPRVMNPEYNGHDTPWKPLVKNGKVISVYMGVRREEVEKIPLGLELEEGASAIANSAPLKHLSREGSKIRAATSQKIVPIRPVGYATGTSESDVHHA
jgi:hypothetical protein